MSRDPNVWSRTNHNFKFVLSSKPKKHDWGYWDKPKAFEQIMALDYYGIYRLGGSDAMEMNLYIIPNKPMDLLKKIRVRIKCISTDKRGDDVHFKYDGLPLIAWISKTDSVQYVVNKYMKESKPFILSCFVMKKNQDGIKKSAIHRNKWNKYKLVDKMNTSTDLLLFRFKPYNDLNIFIPQYKQSVHDFVDGTDVSS